MIGKRKTKTVREPTERQKAVLEFVESHPGATIQAVADKLAVSHTAACYVLRLLQRNGSIHALRQGRSVRHYKAGSMSPRGRLAPLLRDSGRASVLKNLQNAGANGTSINRLATRLGLAFGLVKSTLRELEELGFIQLDHTNGRYRVQLTKAFAALDPGTIQTVSEVPAATVPIRLEVRTAVQVSPKQI